MNTNNIGTKVIVDQKVKLLPATFQTIKQPYLNCRRKEKKSQRIAELKKAAAEKVATAALQKKEAEDRKLAEQKLSEESSVVPSNEEVMMQLAGVKTTQVSELSAVRDNISNNARSSQYRETNVLSFHNTHGQSFRFSFFTNFSL